MSPNLISVTIEESHTRAGDRLLLTPSARRLLGFSLIEIMVALVIGLLGVIVMMQVFSLSEGQKRTTTTNGDAQNNGALSLYTIQRDIRQAGYGINNVNIIGCNVTATGGWVFPTLGSVTINPSALATLSAVKDASTDSLLIFYGNSNDGPDGSTIQVASSNQYTVDSANAFQPLDYVIASPDVTGNPGSRMSPCNLVMDRVTSATITQPNVPVTTGGSSLSLQGGRLYSLGQKPKIWAYLIYGGNLWACDYMAYNCNSGSVSAPTWQIVGDNIVSLRAQYGRDTNSPRTGIATIYDQTTPSTAGTMACDWLKIVSVRIALVARSTQTEKTVVTTTPPVWMGSAADSAASGSIPGNVSLPISVSASPIPLIPGLTWGNYRYKTFQTIIPISNMSNLQAAATGC